MSAGVSPPNDPPPGVRVEPVERHGRPAFGIITFVLAVLVFLIEPALNSLVSTEMFLSQASTISGTVMGVQMLAVVVVLVLAVVAAFRRNGTSWAVAAIAVTVAGNSLFRAGVGYLFELVFRAVYGTPTVLY